MSASRDITTFVAEVGGEAIVVFRALDLAQAAQLARLILDMHAYCGDVHHVDGRPVWDGKAEISVRPSTDAEHRAWIWRQSFESVDPSHPEERDYVHIFLVPLQHRIMVDQNGRARPM